MREFRDKSRIFKLTRPASVCSLISSRLLPWRLSLSRFVCEAKAAPFMTERRLRAKSRTSSEELIPLFLRKKKNIFGQLHEISHFVQSRINKEQIILTSLQIDMRLFNRWVAITSTAFTWAKTFKASSATRRLRLTQNLTRNMAPVA